MIKPALIIAALLLVPLAAHAQVYRCDVNGQPTFQDRPCGDSSPLGIRDRISVYEAPDLPPIKLTRPSQPQRSSQHSQSASHSRYLSSTEMRREHVRARSQGRLAVGMSENQAIQILGHPDNYHRERNVRDRCKSYYWNNPRFSPGYHSASICNGEVSRYSGPSR